MRRLLDGVAVLVPRRSIEPGRPRHRRAPDALVDFHTGDDPNEHIYLHKIPLGVSRRVCATG